MGMTLSAIDPWDGWGHMWGAGWGWLWSGFMMLFWLALVALVVWLVVRAAMDRRQSSPVERSGVDRARDVLAERYARGEISTEEYQDRLTHLGGSS
ncbi:SHOCT domain-containing protein [Nonomuraea sp. NPDC005650]|uniref:SHOCT domain-containing protein n=1 Tax=Nonomuraea sp. NPDC005650 TaxID=3157045 RepID=UPI0033ACFB35